MSNNYHGKNYNQRGRGRGKGRGRGRNGGRGKGKGKASTVDPRPIMCELMAFSATTDPKVKSICHDSFLHRGASDGPDVSLQVYPKGTDLGASSIGAAMKVSLYRNVRKLHCVFDFPQMTRNEQAMMYQHVVTLLMKIHADRGAVVHAASEPLDDTATTTATAVPPAAREENERQIDAQSVGFFHSQAHCFRAREALSSNGVRAGSRTGFPDAFRSWWKYKNLPTTVDAVSLFIWFCRCCV